MVLRSISKVEMLCLHRQDQPNPVLALGPPGRWGTKGAFLISPSSSLTAKRLEEPGVGVVSFPFLPPGCGAGSGPSPPPPLIRVPLGSSCLDAIWDDSEHCHTRLMEMFCSPFKSSWWDNVMQIDLHHSSRLSLLRRGFDRMAGLLICFIYLF